VTIYIASHPSHVLAGTDLRTIHRLATVMLVAVSMEEVSMEEVSTI
jgi:hypothetical protein